MSAISDLVKLSPGYKSAVYVEHDMDNYNKVSAYIPTEVGAKCIELVAKALNPECKERSFLITGTYGTGKSHLALIICNLFKSNGVGVQLNPVMEKIAHKWPERYDAIRQYRGKIEDRPFVIVNLYQHEGRINDALLRELDKTLSLLKVHDLLPDTVFAAALKRIEDIRLKYPDALKVFKKVIDEEGLVSIEDFERRLKNYEKKAFEIFLDLHPRFSQGAKFFSHQDMKAADVYVSTSVRLKERGFGGIIVLWDEFGRYLERSLEDPKGNESLELQEFAEACNDSYLKDTKIFFFLIAHREMQEYLELVNAKMALWKSDAERKAFITDIQKIQKRFHSEIRMKANDTEIYDLIDNVIIQAKENPHWSDIKKKGLFDLWADKCVNAKIFPEFNKDKILDTIIEGAYPLHPVTTCCLPKLSEKVAQNERTLFQFLCKDEPNSVFEFIKNPIEDRNGKLFIITLDRLMDYFKEEAKKSDRAKKFMKEYLNAERMLASAPDIQKRIAKAITVLNITYDKPNTTPDFVTFSLNERLENVSEAFNIMSSKNNGERILIRNSVDGTYRFYGAGIIDIEEEIERIIGERAAITNPIRVLDWSETHDEDNLWNKLGLLNYIEPKSYNDDYRMNRKIFVKPVDIKGLESFKGISSDSAQDGILFLTLYEKELEIKNSTELLNGDYLRDSRVLVAIPKQSINFSDFIRKFDALKRLRNDRKEIFGEGGSYEDEWNHKNEECLELLKNLFSPLLNPEKNLLELYWRGELKRGIVNKARLENLATEMMKEAYPYTPRVLRDELIRVDGNDTFKKHRKPVIDNILREDGPEALAKEVNAPVKSVIESVLKANNILVRKEGSWVIEKPLDDINMSKVWNVIDDFILTCTTPGKPTSQLIKNLMSPPFGIRRRSIPVIIAVPLRKYILRGNITLKEKELPFSKIDSELIESVVANPEKYTIIYAEVGESQKIIVDGMCKVYGLEYSGELGEKIITLREKMTSWWEGLSIYARNTQDISGEAKDLREKVFIPLAKGEADVKSIIFDKIPESINLDGLSRMAHDKIKAKIYGKIGNIKQEFEVATVNLHKKIANCFIEVFAGDKKDNDLIKVITDWHKELGEKGSLIISGDAGKLLEVCRGLKEKKDKDLLVELVTQITGSKPENWPSSTQIDEFKGQLKTIKKTIEEPIPPAPGRDYISISLTIDGKIITRQFKKAESISQIGKSMANLINDAIAGLGPALQEEEKFTVLIEVLKDHLK